MKLHKPNHNTPPIVYTQAMQDAYNEVCKASRLVPPNYYESKKTKYARMRAASQHIIMAPDVRNGFEWLLFNRYLEA